MKLFPYLTQNRIQEGNRNKPPSAKRPKIRSLACWGGLFCICILLHVLARTIPGFAEWYAVTVYPIFVESLGRVCSAVPVSVAEMLLLAAVIGVVVWLVRVIVALVQGVREKNAEKMRLARNLCKKGMGHFVRIGLVLFALYTVLCGINYHRLTFSQRAGFEIQKSTVEELADLCLALTREINEAAKHIEVDAQGHFVIGEQETERAVQAMQAAAEQYPELAGYYPNAKAVRNSWILSYQQLQGVYSPFTVEANYNRDMPDYNKPSTICHELSHLKGFMREDEANFISYLACRASGDKEFLYSGSMRAYVYSTNALYREDPELYFAIRSQLCEQAERDLLAHSEFWNSYEGKVAEVSEKVNDTYLKANSQKDGTKSYGRMVDLLLALRRMEKESR